MANPGRHTADEPLALALVAGGTLAEAAENAGVSERTARRRQGDPAFRRLVADLRGEVIAQATNRLAGAMTRAAERLAELVESRDDRTALSAAKAVLSLGMLARQKLDAEEMTAELIERLDRAETDGRGGGPC